jgi:general nucleoside transport system ATP-binding protein
MSDNYVIEMSNISKSFPGIKANDNITLQVKQGEIHALLGENGAGKSTLMSILFGLYHPDEGDIYVKGNKVNITDPNVANQLKIGMVHQHFKLVHNFTVTENIVLGLEPSKYNLKDSLEKASEEINELSNQYGLNVDPHAKIEDISVGMQQRVEILKMLYRNAEILIFDEPTAVLTPQEIDDLLKILKNLIHEGKSIILITHKLKEIKAVCDRVTVIRKGKYIGTYDVKETSEEKLAEYMVGREVTFKVDKTKAKAKGPILKVENLVVNNMKGTVAVDHVSFEAKRGEILGIAGVEGNGQSELVEAITGLRNIESGQLYLNGQDITAMNVRDKIENGISHIPEDRHKHGLVLDFKLKENLILHKYNQAPFSRFGFLDFKEITQFSEQLIEDFDVRSGRGSESSTRGMSGGNQQKAIIAREIDMSPELLIAAQPTRGLDVGAIEYIHKRLVEERDKGKSVILYSLELDEILNLADRIIVMNKGKIIGEVMADETNEKEIGLMMTGIGSKEVNNGKTNE